MPKLNAPGETSSLHWSPKSILVPTDFSKTAEVALRQAIWLAERAGAKITVTHVIGNIRKALSEITSQERWELVAGDIDKHEKALRKKSDQRLAELLAKFPESAGSIEALSMVGSPYVAVIQAVLEAKHDLVLAGTRGVSNFHRILVGSNAERLVRQCPCPVWIVPDQPLHDIRTMLVAVDFSAASVAAARHAAALARVLGSRVTLLHVIDEDDERLVHSYLDRSPSEYRDEVKRIAQRRVHELGEQCFADQDVEYRIGHGHPARLVCSLADEVDVNLLVLGSVGRSAIQGVLIGNTAEKVIRNCERQVLVVKPDDFVSPIQPAFWRAKVEGRK